MEVGEIQPNDMLPGGIAQEERRGEEEAGGWPEIIEIGKFPEIDYDHDFDFDSDFDYDFDFDTDPERSWFENKKPGEMGGNRLLFKGDSS